MLCRYHVGAHHKNAYLCNLYGIDEDLYARSVASEEEMQVIAVEKPRCNLCAEEPCSFDDDVALERHIRKAHPEQVKYTCEQCGCDFVQKAHLLRHKQIHTGGYWQHAKGKGLCFYTQIVLAK